jgi:hypothetical protein
LLPAKHEGENDMKKFLAIGSALVLGLGVAACNNSPAEESADSAADSVEASGAASADQLNSQADAVESSAASEADTIRDQADDATDTTSSASGTSAAQ